MKPERILVLAGGLSGAAGVALSATAAHAGGGNIGTAASFLLMHAPVFLAIGLLAGRGADGPEPARNDAGPGLLHLAAYALLAGLVLFSGDLLLRDSAGTRVFLMAAPAGGMLMILGWLGIAAAGLRRGASWP